MDPIASISIIIICVLLSAFFSGSETAFTSVNRIRLKTEADDGNKKAANVLNTIEKFDRLISTILIGNNIVNILSASVATIYFTTNFGDFGLKNGSWLSTLVITVIVLIFGEVIPKGFAKNHAESFAKIVNPIILVLVYIFLPFSYCLEGISKLFNKIFKSKNLEEASFSEDELLTIIDEIEDEGQIKPYEKELISSAIKFDDIDVKDIVTPRKDITSIDVNMTTDEIHQIFTETKFTRIPVFSGTIDNVIGILHEKNFYSYLMDHEEKDFNIRKLMKPVHFVSQETKISVAFKMFKDQHYHMAIVLDQFDSTLGLITLEDIIEELVGEIFDETDEIFEETKQVEEDKYIVSGKEILADAFDIMNIEVDSKDDEEDLDLNQTVNSFLSSVFGRLPTSGDNFIFQDEWKISVNSATRKGAKEVTFERI